MGAIHNVPKADHDTLYRNEMRRQVNAMLATARNFRLLLDSPPVKTLHYGSKGETVNDSDTNPSGHRPQ